MHRVTRSTYVPRSRLPSRKKIKIKEKKKKSWIPSVHRDEATSLSTLRGLRTSEGSLLRCGILGDRLRLGFHRDCLPCRLVAR